MPEFHTTYILLGASQCRFAATGQWKDALQTFEDAKVPIGELVSKQGGCDHYVAATKCPRAHSHSLSLSLCLVLCMCTLCNIVVTIDYACVIYIIYVSCCRFSFEWTDRLSKHVMTSLLWELWSLPGPNSQWRCRRRLRHIDHECSGRYAALAWRNFSVSSAGQDDVASY